MYKPVYLELMRPGNCLMAGLASLIGLTIAASGPEPLPAFLVLGAVFLITGAGNAVNDYFDVEIDAVNRPKRPIPSGRISLRDAMIFSAALFIVGCALAAFLNYACLAIALANSLILYLYARSLKGTPLVGNLCVGYLTGSTFLFGGLATGDGNLSAAFVLALLASMATVSREIVKDVEDLEGDRKCGARTLPIVAGERLAAAVAVLFATGAVILSYSAPLGRVYLATVSLANLFFLIAMARTFKGDFSSAQHNLKRGMAVALLAFLGGALGGALA